MIIEGKESAVMRETWVDYAKGIGIILVVFGHANRGLYSSGIYISPEIYHYLDNIIYSFHMPLFFFLSGLFFVSSIKNKSKGIFLWGKVKNVIYPYVVWSLIQGGVEVFFSKYTNAKTSISEVLLFPIYPRAQFWFLYALFMIFVICTIIYHKKYFLKVLPVFFLVSFVIYVYSGDFGNGFNFNYVSQNIVFFFLGCIFSKYYQLLMKILTNKSFAVLTCLFFLMEYLYFIQCKNNYLPLNLYTAFIAFISIAWVSNASILLSCFNLRWLEKIGKLSLIIYLVHILAASGTRIILSKIFHVESWFVHVLLGTFIGVTAPLIFYKLVIRYNLNFIFEYPSRKNKSIV
ncbi:acyltransferase family protein [Klebsiella variicola]|uniref:acyltransferase family protein n=3 Tax=Klebsiella variicola TaxID=244366 RepID=UPI0027D958D0|nr:acyltransferase [Klebsiella variicola]